MSAISPRPENRSSKWKIPRALRFEADVPEALIGHIKLGAKLPVQVARGRGAD